MKIKPGFQLRTLCGESIVVAHGLQNIDFSKIIRLNSTAAFLWNKVGNEEFDAQKLADYLLEEYEVDAETALKDVTKMMNDWAEAGLTE